jgi:hypothetical protein
VIAHDDRDDGTYQIYQEWLGWLLMAAKMQECVLEEKRSWLARSNDFVGAAWAYQIDRPGPVTPSGGLRGLVGDSSSLRPEE